jgi:hypothetical protein
MIVRQRIIEVVSSLSALEGLTVEALRDALLAGETARDGCTANHPSNAPGFYAWSAGICSLREQLIAAGWSRVEEDGLPLIVSPSGGIAIALETGDDGTGVADKIPKTKYTRGPATVAVVVRNKNQTEFWESDQEQVIVPNPTRQTWFLLRRRTDETIFSELSLPDAIGADGRVESWTERIILPPISLDPSSGGILPLAPSGGGDTGDIDVRIRRRS